MVIQDPRMLVPSKFFRSFCLIAFSFGCLQVSGWAQETSSAPEPMVRVSLKNANSAEVAAGDAVTGRIVVEAKDGGLLLELRNGKYKTIKADAISEKSAVDTAFSQMTTDELAKDLLTEVPPGFEIHQTDHYVICSNSAEEYAEFCGNLLERVYDQYFLFMKEQEVVVHEPISKLPVIILQSATEFQEFAEQRNPGRTFKDSPGYYSIVDNQTLLVDLTRDRSVRSVSEIRKQLADQPLQVATVVHESVHQLAFNSGLQVRMADNPVWLSEGLAVYFEPITPRSSTLWTKPGLFNGRLHPLFMNSIRGNQMTVPFGTLVSSDESFLSADSAPAAYAESWGLVSYLFKQEKGGMKAYLQTIGQHKPLQPLSREERIREFEEAFGKSPDETQASTVSFVQRLRVPR
jgi:hypothetical protein